MSRTGALAKNEALGHLSFGHHEERPLVFECLSQFGGESPSKKNVEKIKKKLDK